MSSRIEFITRGVKIMARKRVRPVKKTGTPSKGSINLLLKDHYKKNLSKEQK